MAGLPVAGASPGRPRGQVFRGGGAAISQGAPSDDANMAIALTGPYRVFHSASTKPAALEASGQGLHRNRHARD